MVPQEALITFAGVTKIFVIQDGAAHERQVQTGTRGSGGLVEIVEGVQPDEVVATSGLTKLGNGVAVTVREADAVNSDPSS
jgi:multidrug efflux pump subunit AcrA (membrane-fusion protein)